SGYNIHQFDLPLIRYEFLRVGIDFQIDEIQVIDPMMIYFKKEPRTLSAAYKYYCNQELKDAHSAEADIKATKDILLAQIERYEDVGDTVLNLADYSAPRFRSADLSGRLAYSDKDELLFNFGKYKGEPVKNHIDYAEWMLEKDFPEDTKNILNKFMKNS
ncbi:MAG: 3'-5' exonuclease, partial [Bacteroidota bacterium]